MVAGPSAFHGRFAVRGSRSGSGSGSGSRCGEVLPLPSGERAGVRGTGAARSSPRKPSPARRWGVGGRAGYLPVLTRGRSVRAPACAWSSGSEPIEVPRRGRRRSAAGEGPCRRPLGGAPLAPRRGPSSRPPDARRAGHGSSPRGRAPEARRAADRQGGCSPRERKPVHTCEPISVRTSEPSFWGARRQRRQIEEVRPQGTASNSGSANGPGGGRPASSHARSDIASGARIIR